MNKQYLTGTTLLILSGDAKPLGEVVVEKYLHTEQKYKVWWTYEQTGERELIEVPEWRLLRKPTSIVSRVIR